MRETATRSSGEGDPVAHERGREPRLEMLACLWAATIAERLAAARQHPLDRVVIEEAWAWRLAVMALTWGLRRR